MLTQAEFTRRYCERSGISEERLKRRRAILPCQCGEPECEGWACVPIDSVDEHVETDGPRRVGC